MSVRTSIIRTTTRRVTQVAGMGVVMAIGASAFPATAQSATFVACSEDALSTAITEANAAPSAVLSLAPGCVYSLTTRLPEVTGNITINANGDTITRGIGATAFRILTVSGRLTLNDATVSNGDASGESVNFGGGIGVIGSGSLFVERSDILDNRAAFSGGIGGLSNTTVSVDRTTISGNSVTQSGGGFIADGIGTITNSRVIGNSAGNLGGGIANQGQLRVQDSNINDNEARDGGGIANIGGTAQLIRTNVNSNQATDGVGAGGILRTGGSVILNSSRVRGNAPTNCAGTVPGCTG
ncbi:hypothetical protein [Streptomyces sp. H51]|uniref:hypothetical protein n=1 Tax=Streptomyces sp. H51 TaxID=3111770 RepID=UPI002D7766D0|nr:hypothetical protein [Streptomyces sp. H51]